jgi:hypothetical protein
MKRAILLLLLFFICVIHSKASHIAGADLTYKWVGGNDWEITFTFYRDCSGISEDAQAYIHCSSVSCGQNYTVYLSKVPGTGIEITDNCPSQPTTCTSGSAYGVQEFVYKGIVTLQPCNDWVFYYCSCCRNPPIQTIGPTPDSDGMFIMAMLINTAAATQGGNPNSSPSLTNKPIQFVCVNQPYCYNNGAVDIDGDSLVTTFIAPNDQGPLPYSVNCSGGGGTSVIYTSPWSPTQPITSNPPVNLDSTTGEICMLPTQQLISVMAVMVQEYRNGILIGSIIRDNNIIVLACTNTVPTLPGIDTAATAYNPNDTIYKWDMCAGETLSFDIYPYDPDNNDLTMTSNNGIPAASWNVTGNGTTSPVGHFSWTPVWADAGNTPHCFTIEIKDNSCPYYGSQIFSYCITVKGLAVSLGPDSLLCQGESYTLNATVDPSAINFHWTVNGNPVTPVSSLQYIFNADDWPAGLYTVMLTADDGSANCPGADLVHITNAPAPDIGNDSTICDNEYITLNAGAGYDSYLWSTGVTAQYITVDTLDIGVGTHQYYVDVSLGNCFSSDTVNVTFTSCFGIDEYAGHYLINIYPNPATEVTNIIPDELNTSYILDIYTIQGQLIYSSNIKGKSQLDVSDFPQGMYFIEVKTERGIGVRKFVKE